VKPRARLRAVALVTAALFSVLTQLHFAVIPHTVCEEHGEIALLGGSGEHHGHDEPEPAGEDEHCPAAALFTSSGLSSGAANLALDALPAARFASLPDEAALPHLSYGVLAVSPCNSPPRSS
jgi:hypothetical protein